MKLPATELRGIKPGEIKFARSRRKIGRKGRRKGDSESLSYILINENIRRTENVQRVNAMYCGIGIGS